LEPAIGDIIDLRQIKRAMRLFPRDHPMQKIVRHLPNEMPRREFYAKLVDWAALMDWFEE